MKYLKTYEKFSLFNKLFGKDKEVKNINTVTDKDIRIGDKGDNVKSMQKNLEALGFKLHIFGVDGKYGSETASTVKSLFDFIKNNSELKEFVDDDSLLEIKDRVVTEDQQEMISELVDEDNFKNKISEHFKKVEKEIGDMDVIGKQEMIKYFEDPEEFIVKLKEVSQKLHINPNWLLYIFYKECGFNHHISNKDTNATGLIQWMPSTLKDKKYNGITVEDIKNMSAVKQLDLVYLFYKSYINKINSVQDLYLITFFPAAMNKDSDYIFKTKNVSAETIAKQNPAVDINKDGEITKSEFNDYVNKGIPDKWKNSVNKKLDV